MTVVRMAPASPSRKRKEGVRGVYLPISSSPSRHHCLSAVSAINFPRSPRSGNGDREACVGILGKLVEEHHDVLQNIEAVILNVHRADPDLLDYDVDAALEALVADYAAEQRGTEPREHRLDGARARVYCAVRGV